MERLKQEWQETRIPEQVYLRARNLAWAKIHRRPPMVRTLAWATAASALLAVAILAGLWGARSTRIEQAALPGSPETRTAAVAPAPQVERPMAQEQPRPVTRRAAPSQATRRSLPREAPSVPARASERVVLDFILPETGVRMIWIMDSSFQFDGGGR